jgi:hypothetical protein
MAELYLHAPIRFHGAVNDAVKCGAVMTLSFGTAHQTEICSTDSAKACESSLTAARGRGQSTGRGETTSHLFTGAPS